MVDTMWDETYFHTEHNIAGEVNVITHCNNIIMRRFAKFGSNKSQF